MDEFRNKKGKKAAIFAISSNCFLTAFNIIIGLISGSYALIAEGVHTFSDVITSVIAYLGFKVGQKPADDEHPRGHGRAEAISGVVIVIFLAIVGYEIITTAIDKFLNPNSITVPSYYAAIMALAGIILNLAISSYIIKIGREINSPAIIADGQHQRTDIFSSIAILFGVFASNIGYPILDPIVGMLIGVLILKTAYTIGKENIDNIMGKVPDEKIIKQIEKIANNTKGAHEAHNIKVDNYGAYSIVNLHIKVNGEMTLDEAHKIVHSVQNNILEEIPEVKSVSAHACPLGLEYNHDQEIDN